MIIRYHIPASPADNVSMTYDGFGRVASRTDKSGMQTFTYGNLDEVTSVTTQYVGLPAQTISYTYHPDVSRPQVYWVTLPNR